MEISVIVGRPLTFRDHSVSSKHESRADIKEMDGWYYNALDRYLEAGIYIDQLISMFRSISDELGRVLKKCLQASTQTN